MFNLYIKTHRPETIIAAYHSAHRIAHPPVVEITLTSGQALHKRLHHTPCSTTHPFGTLAVNRHPLLTYLHIASMLNRIFVLRHQVLILRPPHSSYLYLIHFSMLNVQYSILNVQCSMFNAQCSMLNVQCSMFNAQCSTVLCLTASYSRIAALTDTLSESSLPSIGMRICASAAWRHTSVRPVASVPITIAVAPVIAVS